ncbi:hypothetical protein [Pseudomonas koreensis]|uniref:hypothetical protein n=1 Tax=Pseudomonas koreensis TaxID=198620 RepID=UPI001B32175A|nr:hypothetical protein [Pseudomonas koreensis]MBP4002459.1 hypothetical protein [Pseudomonas koreensis]
MSKTKSQTIEIREKCEESRHTLSLFIDICTSNIELCESSKLALSEYGKNKLEELERVEAMLCAYDTTSN